MPLHYLEISPFFQRTISEYQKLKLKTLLIASPNTAGIPALMVVFVGRPEELSKYYDVMSNSIVAHPPPPTEAEKQAAIARGAYPPYTQVMNSLLTLGGQHYLAAWQESPDQTKMEKPTHSTELFCIDVVSCLGKFVVAI